MPRCATCAVDDPVESPQELPAHAAPVVEALRDAGIPLASSIEVRLVSREFYGPVLEGAGPLALGRIDRDTDGSPEDRFFVTIVAGFPGPLFRRVLAHHLGYAFLLDQGVVTTPSWIAEGVAETFAHLYLGRPGASAAERLLGADVGRSSSVRGEVGFRMVRDAIGRHGLPTVVHALQVGDPAPVGLA
jgi:hypothetical protein